MEMKWLLILLVLTGCASQEPVQVKVPVHVPCIDKIPERPHSQFGNGEYPGDKAAAQAALLDAFAWEQYATLLEIQLAGCVSK
jgi:hypothetical protein